MKSKLMKVVVTLSASLLMVIASSTSASACVMGCYQPKEPKSLREE